MSNVDSNSLGEKDFPKARLLWVPMSPRKFMAAKDSPGLSAQVALFFLSLGPNYLPRTISRSPWANPEMVITCSQKYSSACLCLRQLALCLGTSDSLVIPGMFFFFLKQSIQGNNSSPHLILDNLSFLEDWNLHIEHTNLNHILLTIYLEHRQL